MTHTRPGVETLHLEEDDTFPNNRLPVLLYRRAISPQGPDPAAAIEHRFRANGWGGLWRDGIFDFHHFHATTHEVLGCARGGVRVLLGGPNGREAELRAGDVALLPAGTAHRNLGHSDDYLIVGAYPPGYAPDMCYGEPGEHDAAKRAIAGIPVPETDPVYGMSGPLKERW